MDAAKLELSDSICRVAQPRGRYQSSVRAFSALPHPPMNPPPSASPMFRCAALLAVFVFSTAGRAQPQLEQLGRGVVAIHQPDGKVVVSWRLLGTDPDGVAFNLYRKSD